ncbi:MAG: hypothetical protein IJ466_06135 [Clostridia bacterium]|nr:hypothetical protein [Clostridia bacterium]
MNRQDWQSAFGNVPEDFHDRLRGTLNGLEERKMKKRYKFTTVLAAAVILVALFAGAAVAMNELGVFHLLTDTVDPILPLEGAEEMVKKNLGTAENEYAVLTVEEAVFDGQGVLVQCRLTPKDTERYAMFDAFMQDAPDDTYIRQSVPVEVPQGTQECETEAGKQIIVYEEEKQQLLVNGEEVQIPENREEANEKGLIAYKRDGKLYYADFEDFQVLGRRDGREMMGYWINIGVGNELIFMDTGDAREDADGSIIWWESGIADEMLDVSEIEMHARAVVRIDDQEFSIPEINFVLPKSEAEQKYDFTPAGNAFGERFEILNCSLTCTKVRGYLKIEYRYQQAEEGEEMGIDFRLYDSTGERINTGSGGSWEENGVFHWDMEMQSFEEVPESIFLEAKVIGEDKTLGRVECRLVEE